MFNLSFEFIDKLNDVATEAKQAAFRNFGHAAAYLRRVAVNSGQTHTFRITLDTMGETGKGLLILTQWVTFAHSACSARNHCGESRATDFA